MTTAQIEITKIVNGGYGLGHLPGGQVILVRHALPNESHIVTVSNEKKNLSYGSTGEILAANPMRRPAPCPHYARCGGCDLQHCHYQYQTTIKKSILIDMLERLGGGHIKNAASLIKPVLAAPDEFYYRQRIRLQVTAKGELGFHRFHANAIIPVAACLLAAPPINQCLSFLQHNKETKPLLQLSTEVELQCNPLSGKVVALFHLSRKPRPADSETAKKLSAGLELIEAIYFSGPGFPLTSPSPPKKDQESHALTGSTQLAIRYPDVAGLPGECLLGWEPGGFCQVNLAQNRVMIEKVLQFCDIHPGDSVLDLFCGMGNFSIPLALRGATVEGYEGQGAAIRAAIRNSHRADTTTRTRFTKKPVHEACQELVAAGRTFDCVVIDPPRQGGPELASLLFRLTGKTLVYVSCDPATLIRDLNDLTSCGFVMQDIQPIDMFPQTHHIETMILLKRG